MKKLHKIAIGAVAGLALTAPLSVPAALAAPAAVSASSVTIKYGQSGAKASAVQLLLANKGYKLSVDGKFGAQTKAAVISFQKKNGLEADGVVGPKTLKKLAPVTKSGAKGNEVKAVQTLLRGNGYNIAADGSYGPKTSAAVKAFQKKKGLSADGVVGPITWGSLLGGSSSKPEPPKGDDSKITYSKCTKQVAGWIAEARSIMIKKGMASSEIRANDICIIAMNESSGNPKAVNNWDSNADNGTPSKGLMQTIQPTFDENKLPGHGDIFDPVDNIIAACRYAVARYGSLSQTPGPASVNNGGPYKPY